MVKKEYIAHTGSKYEIEWYYDTSGRSQAQEYFDKLPSKQKRKLFYLFEVMGSEGIIQNEEKFRHEGDQIYAFKPKPDRFLCFFYRGGKIIITNAFVKKSDKLPPREKEKALRYRKDYIARCNEDIYYE
jgi:phage-related protein